MRQRLSFAMIAAGLLASGPVQAAPSLATADSFRIGTGGVLCTAQNRSADKALSGMFDRAHGILCKDAASEVGKLFQLRGGTMAAMEKSRDPALQCEAPQPVTLGAQSGVMGAECTHQENGLRYKSYWVTRGKTLYAAEGLAGYDSALQLGLQTILADQPVSGSVEVAVTEAGDPTAFARVQAGIFDPAQARAEGYGRNNSGNYAEASAFFEVLSENTTASDGSFGRSAEYLANQALQQSNLGNFPEADSLFAKSEKLADGSDVLLVRLLRNFRMMHELNQRQPAEALDRFQRGFEMANRGNYDGDRLAQGFIDRPVSQQLNSDSAEMSRLGGVGQQLTLAEKIEILDLQAEHLRGAALRQQGKFDAARALVTQALTRLTTMRGGKVASVTWLRAANLTELALLAEAQGKASEARKHLDEASLLVATDYPGSASALMARARLGGFLARQGQREEARAIFREVVAQSAATPGAGSTVRTVIGPYLRLLADISASDASAASDFFSATQILARPGVAQTQAVLARELSGGSDEASALFRQSVNLSRDVVRLEAELARLRAAAELTTEDTARLPVADRELAAARAQQTQLLASLAAYPRFRVLGTQQMAISELQTLLRDGEAYYKLVINGGAAYGLFIQKDRARVFPVSASEAEIAKSVATIRDSIVTIENDQVLTFAFDIARSRALYVSLFGPVDEAMAGIKHLVFEPDGAMLQLPANLLVTDQASVDRYQARMKLADADEYDFRGTAWLGRGRIVSTAVSPRAFADVRVLEPAKGEKAYLGLGENARIGLRPASAALTGSTDCQWPMGVWGRPISSDELRLGAKVLGEDASEVLIQDGFTDNALRARTDLSNYRVIHFATHGLVTAPKPECPAQPSLVTSFGDGTSDGLLSFKEIFDLKLDADTIILSACDTAGMATVAATREAGISTGGNYALDGLVRAFVGAGARSVVASHWPVPDDFNATQTLISSLFDEPGINSLGAALNGGQQKLMDAAETSHPYYWSGFAIVGDATKPLIGR